MDKTTCVLDPDAPTSGHARVRQTVTVTFKDMPTLTQTLQCQKGIDPPLTNEEILEKWRMLAMEVIDEDRISCARIGEVYGYSFGRRANGWHYKESDSAEAGRVKIESH